MEELESLIPSSAAIVSVKSGRLNGGPFLRVFFSNGYGVSVVSNPYSYGGSEGMAELAVLKSSEDSWVIAYDTLVTSDVMGYLEECDVKRIIAEVAGL